MGRLLRYVCELTGFSGNSYQENFSRVENETCPHKRDGNYKQQKERVNRKKERVNRNRKKERKKERKKLEAISKEFQRSGRSCAWWASPGGGTFYLLPKGLPQST